MFLICILKLGVFQLYQMINKYADEQRAKSNNYISFILLRE